MENEKRYSALFTADDIRDIFFEYIDLALPPQGFLRLEENDIVRMAYMARGAKDLADAIIDGIEGKNDEKDN